MTGEVDLLIGSEVAHLHPVQHVTVGKMVVKTSIFGGGWVLNGSHEGIVCGQVKFDKTVQLLRSGCYRSNRITVKYSQQVQFSSVEEYEYELSEKKFMGVNLLKGVLTAGAVLSVDSGGLTCHRRRHWN